MDITQALDKAWNDFDPLRPVPPEDPHGWYVDLGPVRGPITLVDQLARNIQRRSERPQRVLVLGHAGSGKSTELGRLRRRLESHGYRCVLVEADKDLDREDLDIVEVQVLLIERIGAMLLELDLKLPAATLERLHGWFSEEEAVSEREARASTSASMIGLFKNLLPDWKADLQVSEARRTVLRTKVRKHLREFVDLVADLVDEANGLLQQHDLQGLVLLIDGVEKAALTPEGLARVCRIVIEHVEQWARLQVNLVITAPLEVLSQGTRLQNHYHKYYLIPSVPVAGRPDLQPAETRPAYVNHGRALLREVIKSRARLEDLFDDEATLEPLIDFSGGSIRDLFRLIQAAIDAAAPGHRIEASAAGAAIRSLQIQMQLQMQPEDHAPLRALMANPEELDYDATGVRLLQRELALHYINGGSWFGVHPAFKDRVRP
jgi:hypothetical protein